MPLPLSELSRREAREFAALERCARAAIELRCKQRSLSRRQLEECIGRRGRIAEVMNGKRSLSKAMICKLYVNLGIPLEHLLEIRT